VDVGHVREEEGSSARREDEKVEERAL